MFFTYGASIVLISLAIYGLLCLLYDLYEQVGQRNFHKQAGISLLILVKDMEQEIEMLMYDLIARVEQAALPCDVVIVDCDSKDLTYAIACRMAASSTCVEVVRRPGDTKPVNEALPLCRGEIIHVLDLVSRLPHQQLIPAVRRLLATQFDI